MCMIAKNYLIMWYNSKTTYSKYGKYYHIWVVYQILHHCKQGRVFLVFYEFNQCSKFLSALQMDWIIIAIVITNFGNLSDLLAILPHKFLEKNILYIKNEIIYRYIWKQEVISNICLHGRHDCLSLHRKRDTIIYR